MTSARSFGTMQQCRQTGSRRRRASPTRPAMTYATYIGRVGALALALGVGAAVATGCGVAWADRRIHRRQVRHRRGRTRPTGSSPSTSGGVSDTSAVNSAAASTPSIAVPGTSTLGPTRPMVLLTLSASGATGLEHSERRGIRPRWCARRGHRQKADLTPPAERCAQDVPANTWRLPPQAPGRLRRP